MVFEDIHPLVDEFAREYNKNVLKENTEGHYAPLTIQQIWYGKDSENGIDTLFLITDKRFSDNLERAISDFELSMMREKKIDLRLQTWPCGYRDSEKHGFSRKLFDYVSKGEESKKN